MSGGSLPVPVESEWQRCRISITLGNHNVVNLFLSTANAVNISAGLYTDIGTIVHSG